MANVLHRTTKEYILSVNTPDYSESDWIINPDLSAVKDLPQSYWIIDGDEVRPPNLQELVVIQAAEFEALKTQRIAQIDARTAELLQLPIEVAPDKFIEPTDSTYRCLQDIVIGTSLGILPLPQTIPLVGGAIYTVYLNSDFSRIMGIIITKRRAIVEQGNSLRQAVSNAETLDALGLVVDNRG